MDWVTIALMGGLAAFLIGSRWLYAWRVRTKPEPVFGPGGRLYGRRADGSFVTWWLRRPIEEPQLLNTLHRAWSEQKAGRPNPYMPRGKGGGGGADLSGCLDIFRLFD